MTVQPLPLSRWPSLQISDSPPDNSVNVYVVDPANIPKDIKKMTDDFGLSTDNGSASFLTWKGESAVSIFIFVGNSNVRTQRSLMNKLLDKFKSLSGDYSFTSCNLCIRTDLFNAGVLESFMLSLYEFAILQEEENNIKDIYVSGDISETNMKVILRIAGLIPWVYLVQDLVNYPPSFKPPLVLAETIRHTLHKIPDINIAEWRKDGVNNYFDAVWKVGQGSANDPVILRIEYKPENPANEKPIVVVGKGVPFDSGGMNIKTGKTLAEMKLDMAGAASTASIVGYVASRKWPVHLVAYLPIAENLHDANSMKTSDVVRIPVVKEPDAGSKNDFEYIEVTDTDAEGRLLLSSMVSYAALHDEPAMIITIASLCGTTEGMLGPYMAAAISTGKKLVDDIQAAGFATDENYGSIRVPPDIIDECRTDMRGSISRWQNYNEDVEGDSLLAFSLIQHFAWNVPFLHLDICGVSLLKSDVVYKSKKRRLGGATGWGVRSVSEFLRRRFNLD